MKYLSDDRIRLRALEPDDIDILYCIENDTEEWGSSSSCTPCSRYVLNNYICNSAHDFLIDGQLRLAIERFEDNAVVGMIELFDHNPLLHKAELGIIIIDGYRCKGYASRAITLVKKYAASFFHLNQIYVYVSVDNVPAVELFRKNGFTVSGTLRNWISSEGNPKDAYIMQCLDF